MRSEAAEFLSLFSVRSRRRPSRRRRRRTPRRRRPSPPRWRADPVAPRYPRAYPPTLSLPSPSLLLPALPFPQTCSPPQLLLEAPTYTRPPTPSSTLLITQSSPNHLQIIRCAWRTSASSPASPSTASPRSTLRSSRTTCSTTSTSACSIEYLFDCVFECLIFRVRSHGNFPGGCVCSDSDECLRVCFFENISLNPRNRTIEQPPFEQAVAEEVPEQDERRHPAPLDAELQPGAERGDHQVARERRVGAFVMIMSGWVSIVVVIGVGGWGLVCGAGCGEAGAWERCGKVQGRLAAAAAGRASAFLLSAVLCCERASHLPIRSPPRLRPRFSSDQGPRQARRPPQVRLKKPPGKNPHIRPHISADIPVFISLTRVFTICYYYYYYRTSGSRTTPSSRRSGLRRSAPTSSRRRADVSPDILGYAPTEPHRSPTLALVCVLGGVSAASAPQPQRQRTPPAIDYIPPTSPPCSPIINQSLKNQIPYVEAVTGVKVSPDVMWDIQVRNAKPRATSTSSLVSAPVSPRW